ncbi:MAG TPA: phasin family protein [Thioalkalivibrio sp.]|nr:phasin family protein [Thioalkalivibrio sp.]
MKEMFEMMNKMSQNTYETSRRLAGINQSAMEKLMAQQMELMDAWMDSGVKNLELMSAAKGYQDVASGQAELAREYGQKVMAGYKSGAEVMTEVRDATTRLMDEAARSAGENVKQATSAASKRAA